MNMCPQLPGKEPAESPLPALSPRRRRSRLVATLACLLIFFLCAELTLYAQRTGTGNRSGANNRRTTAGGGRSFGGAGGSSSRSYYPSGMVGEALVTSDPETRRLIVITDEETGHFVSQVITNLDRPKPQVLIKVVFLEVTYRNTLDFGIEGGARHNADGNAGAGASSFGLGTLGMATNATVLNSLGLPVQSFAPTPPGAGVYQILGGDFQATIRAIAQAGKMEILSKPSILTRNSQQATISLGQEVPLVTNTRFDTLGNQINTVTYQNVGIILRVTPFITENEMVEMIVSPESSGLTDRSQWVPIANGISAPVINSRIADTVVVVPDGQIVVIGGLMQNSKMSTDNKIPLLGDIPVLGNLFKRKIKDDSKTELIIFLKPTIVRNPVQLAGMSATEKDKAQLMPKAFSNEELDRYLESLPTNQNSPDGKEADKGKKKKSSSKKVATPDTENRQ